MSTTPLSAAMAEALGTAIEHGGKLERHAGGYWTWPKCPRTGSTFPYLTWWAGTSTIEALVKRGELEYTGYRDGRVGRFPIVASVRKSGPSQDNDRSTSDEGGGC